MIIAIIQARMSSTRLPGKVLMEINERPILDILVKRLAKSVYIGNNIVIATSTDTSDDAIADFCQTSDLKYYRGSLDDVLARYYNCAVKYQADHIVRITADCPLIDPEIVDAVITKYLESEAEYTSNTINPKFPDGLDVEIFSMQVLEKIHLIAKLPSQREHVTKYINDNRNKFKVSSYESLLDFSTLRWTVDNIEDFYVVQAICNCFKVIDNVGYEEILQLYQRDDVKEILSKNIHLKRNEGLLKSVIQDKQFIKENNYE